MAAFERVLSGISDMDKALDNIRLGDNVVWRVSSLDEFKLFMEPYVRQAIEDKRNIIYFRFASHEPLLQDRPEIKTVNVPLSHRFENFTVDIHNVIEKEGYDATAVCEDHRILRAGSVYHPFEFYPGGWFRKCVCR